jgi:transcriptional regulator with XRE-family HTH domain
MGRLGWSQSKISRLETGDTPYNQDDLEAAAEAYSCTKTQLIEMNPCMDGDVVDLLALLKSANEAERRAMISFLSALKTGTDS